MRQDPSADAKASLLNIQYPLLLQHGETLMLLLSLSYNSASSFSEQTHQTRVGIVLGSFPSKRKTPSPEVDKANQRSIYPHLNSQTNASGQSHPTFSKVLLLPTKQKINSFKWAISPTPSSWVGSLDGPHQFVAFQFKPSFTRFVVCRLLNAASLFCRERHPAKSFQNFTCRLTLTGKAFQESG